MDVEFGNALIDSKDYRGWFVGRFVEPVESLRSTENAEVKWGVHGKGEKRADWASNDTYTLSILIDGRFRISFESSDCILQKKGDYALWAPGVSHTWEALEESIILTVRWPSTRHGS